MITDLAKLGKPGTKFTHDFFVPGTLITFPSVAISDVAKIPDVTSAVGALSLEALHESGTVPVITDTYKTGGQTISTTVKPPTLTAAQTAAERSCITKLLQKTFGSSGARRLPPAGSPVAGPGLVPAAPTSEASGRTRRSRSASPRPRSATSRRSPCLRRPSPGSSTPDDQHRHLQLPRRRRGPH